MQVLEPRHIWWEKKGVFNPGVCQIGGKIHLLYRAVGGDNISRFGLAVSDDGENFIQFDAPIIEPELTNQYERLGMEDPRIQQLGRDFYITYTAASVYAADHFPKKGIDDTHKTPWRIRVSAIKTRDMRNFDRLGIILPELDSKDAVLLPGRQMGYNWLIHRVDPTMFIARSKNLRKWEYNVELMAPKEKWEELKIGAAGPVIEIDEGYLMIYHGVSKTKVYSQGVALLSKENPLLVLKRSKKPILSPKYAWEKKGFVSNVVFATGHVVRNEIVYLYYGAADTSVGLVKIPLRDLVKALDD